MDNNAKDVMLAVFNSLNERPIAYHRAYARLTGSTTAGLLLSQLIYWSVKMGHAEFWKTNEELEEETGLSRKEMLSAKKKIVAYFKIQIKGIPAKTFYTLNLTVLIESLGELYGDNKQSQKGTTSSPKRGQLAVPKGDSHICITETTTETTDIEKDTPLSIPPVEHPSPGVDLEGESDSIKTLMGRFKEFWEAYPKKKSKGQAERAWKQIKPDQALLETMLGSIGVAKRSLDWQKEGGQYIPHPATWLRAKGWEDGKDVLPNAEGGVRSPQAIPVTPEVQDTIYRLTGRGIKVGPGEVRRIEALIKSEGCLPQDFRGNSFVLACEHALSEAKRRVAGILSTNELGRLASETLERLKRGQATELAGPPERRAGR